MAAYRTRARRILSGLRTFATPPSKGTGSPNSARYYYSVYLRHLLLAASNGLTGDLRVVAEIGPGDALGLGFAALLSGAQRYCAFDVMEHASVEHNRAIFDGLTALFRARAPIPGDDEFPEVKPLLEQYRFPAWLLTEERLVPALADERVAALRAAMSKVASGAATRGPISYVVPWTGATVLEADSVDLIISQAVMEHVDALEEAYAACFRWLRPGGMMSHQVDYSSHELADEWNGHWTYSDPVWWAIRGGRTWSLNRIAHSGHLRLIREQGFELVGLQPVTAVNTLTHDRLAPRFRTLTSDDLRTCCALIQARKPG